MKLFLYSPLDGTTSITAIEPKAVAQSHQASSSIKLSAEQLKKGVPKMQGICHCGRVSWTLDTSPESVTSCNCTICRRYGVLWAYGYIGHDIRTSGETTSYRRPDGGAIDFHFCKTCGCVTHYVATVPGEDGRHWTAVNLRLTEPDPIADLPIDHFDGLNSFDDLPRDDRRVSDMWF